MPQREERRQEDRETRDMAVRALSQIDQHMTDCEKFRETVANTLGDFREDLKKLNWRMALIVGGIIVAGKIGDFFLPLVHH